MSFVLGYNGSSWDKGRLKKINKNKKMKVYKYSLSILTEAIKDLENQKWWTEKKLVRNGTAPVDELKQLKRDLEEEILKVKK